MASGVPFDDIPVLRPTASEFLDFRSFVEAHLPAHRSSGLVRVIPPAGWSARPGGVYPRGECDRVAIPVPIRQFAEGSRGCFQVRHEAGKKASIGAFRERAKREGRYMFDEGGYGERKSGREGDATRKNKQEGEKGSKGDKGDGRSNSGSNDDGSDENVALCSDELRHTDIDAAERRFWRSLLFGHAVYGADAPGTLFHPDVDAWNLSLLPSILTTDWRIKMQGITEPMLYVGTFRSTFAWHVEDVDLYSINYLHFGAPKVWYSVSSESREDFEKAARSIFPSLYSDCREFLRHKTSVISPQVLHKRGVRMTRGVHYPGEFMITYAGSYHAGFNTGFNVAEAVNFAIGDWINVGRVAKYCKCNSDSVFINVDHFLNNRSYSADINSNDKDDGDAGSDNNVDNTTTTTNNSSSNDNSNDNTDAIPALRGEPGKRILSEDDTEDERPEKKARVNEEEDIVVLLDNTDGNFEDINKGSEFSQTVLVDLNASDNVS